MKFVDNMKVMNMVPNNGRIFVDAVLATDNFVIDNLTSDNLATTNLVTDNLVILITKCNGYTVYVQDVFFIL